MLKHHRLSLLVEEAHRRDSAVTLFDIDIEHCPDCSGAPDDHPLPTTLWPSRLGTTVGFSLSRKEIDISPVTSI